MPWTSCLMSSSFPAVLPLVSRNSVTSIGTDSIDTASIDCSTPLSVSRKSRAVRLGTTRLPRLTEALTETDTAVARKTRCPPCAVTKAHMKVMKVMKTMEKSMGFLGKTACTMLFPL